MSHFPIEGSTPADPFSAGIVAQGRFVFVSGQGPFRDGAPVLGSVTMETLLALENVRLVLRAAGVDLPDVVQCRVFLADIASFDEMNAAYKTIFTHPRPARTTVGASLALGIKVEIDAIAVIPEA